MKLAEPLSPRSLATATGATTATFTQAPQAAVAKVATVAVANHELDSEIICASHHGSVLRWWKWKAMLLGGEIIVIRQW